jgi:sulfur-oxidizing protein SoxZ
MAKKIRMKASVKDGVVQVKAIITHPMETGLRKDKKTGEPIPAHFIQEVVVEHNGTNVLTAYWGGSVSKNPYLKFFFKGGAKGDKIKLSWKDNQGETASKETKIK